jgi:class 3 adenylate cyclase
MGTGSVMTIDGNSMPTGTVTFLLTDVEGSMRGWETAPQRMRDAIARQFDILATSIEAHEGYRPAEQGEGDSVVGAFERAPDAVRAAVDAQRALLGALDGVFRVRPCVAPVTTRGPRHPGRSLPLVRTRRPGPGVSHNRQ